MFGFLIVVAVLSLFGQIFPFEFVLVPAIICNLETHTNTHAVLCRVVSGRPWHYDGDNPAPYIDPVRDYQIKVLNLIFLPRQAQADKLRLHLSLSG